MIVRLALAMLAGAALAAPGEPAEPAEGAISLEVHYFNGSLMMRMTPDGVLTVDRPAAAGLPRETRDVGFASYRRLRALVEPVRKWAGSTVPCNEPRNEILPLSDWRRTPPAVVRWEAEGRAVRVPLTCAYGPARNEIELVRAAVDALREWSAESPEPSDPLANSVEENVVIGND